VTLIDYERLRDMRPDHAQFMIRDSTKFAIFYSYKICKQCKWIRRICTRRLIFVSFRFFNEIKGRASSRIAHSLAAPICVRYSAR